MRLPSCLFFLACLQSSYPQLICSFSLIRQASGNWASGFNSHRRLELCLNFVIVKHSVIRVQETSKLPTTDVQCVLPGDQHVNSRLQLSCFFISKIKPLIKINYINNYTPPWIHYFAYDIPCIYVYILPKKIVIRQDVGWSHTRIGTRFCHNY